MGTRVVNEFGTLGYHKGYTGDRITYSVLAIDRILKDEKERIRATVKTLVSIEDAKKQVENTGWSLEVVDRLGRVQVLKKNGIEVALFFKRQMVEEQPGPGDPVPERVVEDPANLWQRLDMIGPSAKQANLFIKREVDQAREKIGLLQGRCDNLEQLVGTLESTIVRRESSIASLNERIEKLYKKFIPDDKIIVRLPGYKYMTEKQAKVERAKMAKVAKKKGKR